MGTGSFKGGANKHHSLSENIINTCKNYKYNNGYFGDKSLLGGKGIRIISSKAPLKIAKEFYDSIAYGGIEKDLPNGKGKYAKLADGTIISFRPISSSDKTPAVDINITKSNNSGGVKKQKIHFINGGPQ